MTDPSAEAFRNYLNTYERDAKGEHLRSAAEVRELHLDRLPRWIGHVAKDARILEAGCATGFQLSLLYAEGYRKLHGVDISEQLVAEARNRLPEEVVLRAEGILEFLAKVEDGAFDVILFHHVLEHVPRDQTLVVLKEFFRVLAPGGRLNIRVPNASCLMSGIQMFRDFTHVVHFNEYSLIQVLELSGFDVKKVELISHPPLMFWSWKHPGRAVLRMLNRVRWTVLKITHHAVCSLVDLHPAPRAFEHELDVVVFR